MTERLSERERIKGLRRTDFNIALQRLAKSDCGDNSCIFAGKGKGGMRTNGGCRCYQMLTNDIVALIEADRARIVEKCAKIAEHQKEICGSSMSRQSTAQDIADNIRRAGGE